MDATSVTYHNVRVRVRRLKWGFWLELSTRRFSSANFLMSRYNLATSVLICTCCWMISPRYASTTATTSERRLSGGSTKISVNLERILSGRSCLPMSVAGFMAPNIRKSLWAWMRSVSPVSGRSIEGSSTSELVKRSAKLSSKSGEARFISSRSTQSPPRIAWTIAPSTKENEIPLVPPQMWFSRFCTLYAKPSHLLISCAWWDCSFLFFRLGSFSPCSTTLSEDANLGRTVRRASLRRTKARLHRPFAIAFARASKNFWFCCFGNVACSSWSNSALKEIAIVLGFTGLNPPSKSATSLCCERFMMTSLCPRAFASCWIIAVLPIPVSPTKRQASDCWTLLATHSKARSTWLVAAKLSWLSVFVRFLVKTGASYSLRVTRPMRRDVLDFI